MLFVYSEGNYSVHPELLTLNGGPGENFFNLKLGTLQGVQSHRSGKISKDGFRSENLEHVPMIVKYYIMLSKCII